MRGKKGMEFGFAWIFAIVVGAIIIFLAIYSSSRIINVDRNVQDTEIGREIGILLSPVETNLEDAEKTAIILPGGMRIFNECDSLGSFGSQDISVSLKSGIGSEWQEPGIPSSFHNKYIFSESTIEGKRLEVIAKPFEMPFKVADVIIILGEKDYCFVSPPRYVEEEIMSLSIDKINMTSGKGECKSGSVKVCFSGSDCDIDVALNPVNDKSGSVKRKFVDGVHFEGEALLYGAIFADPGIYECQVKRLMQRTSELAGLYLEKSEYLTQKNC